MPGPAAIECFTFENICRPAPCTGSRVSRPAPAALQPRPLLAAAPDVSEYIRRGGFFSLRQESSHQKFPCGLRPPPSGGNALLQNSVEAVRGTYGFAPAARRQHPLPQRLRSAGHCPHHFLTTLDQPCGYSLPLAFCAENAASYPRTLPCRRPCSGGVISALDACKPCPARQQTRPLGKAAAWSASKLSAPAPPALEGYFRHSPATQPLKIPAAKCCR